MQYYREEQMIFNHIWLKNFYNIQSIFPEISFSVIGSYSMYFVFKSLFPKSFYM
jgi:hypothetical protein